MLNVNKGLCLNVSSAAKQSSSSEKRYSPITPPARNMTENIILLPLWMGCSECNLCGNGIDGE